MSDDEDDEDGEVDGAAAAAAADTGSEAAAAATAAPDAAAASAEAEQAGFVCYARHVIHCNAKSFLNAKVKCSNRDPQSEPMLWISYATSHTM